MDFISRQLYYHWLWRLEWVRSTYKYLGLAIGSNLGKFFKLDQNTDAFGWMWRCRSNWRNFQSHCRTCQVLVH